MVKNSNEKGFSKMKKKDLKKRAVFLIKIMVFLAVVLYSTGYASTEKAGLLIPMGRLLKNNNKVQLSINSKPFEPEVIEDGSGGFWFKIPFDKLQKNDQVDIKIVKTNSIPCYMRKISIKKNGPPLVR
jgi:hypothetical protein